eukprot:Transcript_18016.p2 GENE.Transcript_18016~~Transcript_18016.p2  ORF type:complete len:201 (-),score=72.22 Transcript_18016:219-821(-)
MDRALSILGADVPAPVVAQKQVVQKVLTKKEKEALEAKKKDEKKRAKIAAAMEQQAAGKPKLTKAQQAAAKAKESGEPSAAPAAAEPKAAPKPKLKPKPTVQVDASVAEKTLSAPMPDKVVSYRSRTLAQMQEDAEARSLQAALEARQRHEEEEEAKVRQHIAKGACKLTVEEWQLLRRAMLPPLGGDGAGAMEVDEIGA